MECSILVVEQDPATRNLVTRNLRHAGYKVIHARSYSEAEELARTTRPAAALFDWTPETPALTFVRQLRSDERTAQMSLIIVSARSSEQDRVAALESGADDYVTKPYSVRELLARIKAVLRRRTPHLADDTVVIRGLKFEPAARRVTADGCDIQLRNTEFRLLHFFMTHPQRTFSRCQLLDEVWGNEAFVEERTVDVHVRRLRRALARSRHDALIETVRGIGYRFRSDARPAPTSVLSSAVAALVARAARAQPAQAVGMA
jgi:two-component system, OmpR family, phosphate regulon response regulator PhoB